MILKDTSSFLIISLIKSYCVFYFWHRQRKTVSKDSSTTFLTIIYLSVHTWLQKHIQTALLHIKRAQLLSLARQPLCGSGSRMEGATRWDRYSPPEGSVTAPIYRLQASESRKRNISFSLDKQRGVWGGAAANRD